jgi:hypothetical protein
MSLTSNIDTSRTPTRQAPGTFASPKTRDELGFPLRRGWEQRKDPQGRTYYADHKTRTTSWVQPKPDYERERTTSVQALPPGWEQRYPPDGGRPYFFDHNTRTNTWDHPTWKVKSEEEIIASLHGAEWTSEDSELPYGVRVRLEGRTGGIYFVDVNDPNSKTWRHPVTRKIYRKIPPPPYNSLDQGISPSSRRDTCSPATPVASYGTITRPDGRILFGIAVDEDGNPLPLGWERRYCRQKGRVYYVDHNTRTTSWDTPRIFSP